VKSPYVIFGITQVVYNNMTEQDNTALLHPGKALGLALDRESAKLLLDGLESLPANQKSIHYQKLTKKLTEIITIWDRRIKNEAILKERRKKPNDNKKS